MSLEIIFKKVGELAKNLGLDGAAIEKHRRQATRIFAGLGQRYWDFETEIWDI